MNIYKIAELAGVSPSTVSKVINNKGNISEGTRIRIMKIISQNNFQPRICSNISSNIAVFYRKSQGDIFSSSYASAALSGISNYFFDKEQNLLLINTDKIPTDRNQFQVFCHRNHIEGAIFLDLKVIDDYVTQIDGIIPFVILNVEFSGEDIYCIGPDDFQGAYDAMQYLFDMGHQRIAFSLLDQQYLSHIQRFEAYKTALSERGISLVPHHIFDETKIKETSFRMLYDSWKQKGDVPTAIFCTNDDTAVALSSFLRLFGIRVPEDISIIGFDDYSYSIHLSPALTTVHQPIYQIGFMAAQIIDDHINSKNTVHKDTNIKLAEELIIRHSVQKIGSPVLKVADSVNI